MSEHKDFDREEFLLNVPDDIEARIIESKLKLYGIPVMRKYRGSSAYVNLYAGNTVFGIDLYVPSRALEAAKEIIRIDNEPETCECENDSGTCGETRQNIEENIEQNIELSNMDFNEDETIEKDGTRADPEKG